MSLLRSGLVVGVVILVGMFIVDCGARSSSAATSDSSPTLTAASSNPALSESSSTSATSTGCTAQPNIVCGRLVDSRGHPVTHALVDVYGVPSASGQSVDYRPSVDSDGIYSLRVPDGNYTVKAYAEPTYLGYTWDLPLHPDNNVDEDSLPSANGVVKNFTWQLTGVRAGMNDPTSSNCCYGATISFASLAGYSRDPSQWGALKGTIVHFTLTPQGPLVDGSTGQTITFDKTLDDALGFADAYKTDIPFGTYTMAATATAPNGTTLSVRLDPNTTTWRPDDIRGASSGIEVLYVRASIG